MQDTVPRTTMVFTSYAHEDERHRETLRRGLVVLQRSGLIDQWSDHDIQPGQEWSAEILEKLHGADLILLLVSTDFLASDYCWGVELARALERHQKGEARVIPVVVRPADWEDTPLAKLKALPDDGRPITLWENQDEAWLRVTREIRTVVESLQKQVRTLQAADKRLRRWPKPLSAVVGREQETAQVRALLAGDARLVTLVGPPGVGKSELALQACSELHAAFPDGACRVPLVDVADPALVLSEIARALRVEQGQRPLREGLQEAIGDDELLLLLDGFQQLGPATSVVRDLLDGCPGLKVLVTSREQLGARGEHVLPVDPLPVPLPHIRALEEIRTSPAVDLFVHKARDSGRSFGLTRENAADVAELCRRLDGLPLALELAAGQVRMLSPREMLACLPDLLEPMSEAVNLSVGLLEEQEQQLFARLAVFSEGCTYSSAQVVCGGSNVFRQLRALLRVSLLYLRQEAGENRWTMLQPVREQASALLDGTGDRQQVLLRHAEHYRSLAEEAEPGIESSEQERWMELMDAEHGNCSAVLERALAGEVPVEEGVRLAGALGPLWYVRGAYTEGRRWLQRLRELDQPVNAPSRAKALVLEGIMTYHQCDYDLATRLLEDGRSLFEQLDDSPQTTQLLAELGFASKQEGVAKALNCLAFVRKEQGAHDESVELYEQSLRLYRQIEDAWGTPWTATDLALALLTQSGDNAPRAVDLLEESLQWQREGAGQPSGHALTQLYLAYARLAEGRLDEATRLAEESLQQSRELGYGRGISLGAHFLGLLHHGAGRSGDALRLLRESLRQRQEQRDRVGVAECVDSLAAAHEGQEDHVRAAQLLGLAERLWEEAGGGRRQHREYAEASRRVEADLDRLAGPEWQAARTAGRRLQVDDLLEADR